MVKKVDGSNLINILRKKVVFWRYCAGTIFLLSIIAIMFHFSPAVIDWFYSQTPASIEPPYRDRIQSIIQPLRYSSIPPLEHNNVSLSLNFKDETWTINHFRAFDPSGSILLPDDTYGTCVELMLHTYDRIRPFIDNKYTVEFARCAEPNFSPQIGGRHFVIVISKKELLKSIEFILDPSFKRYGHMDQFDDYYLIERYPPAGFSEQHSTDITMPINRHVHAAIVKHNYLLSFTVIKNDEAFDRRNFIVAVTVRKRFNYAAKMLYVLRYNNGKPDEWESGRLYTHIRNTEEYKRLKKRARELFDQLIVELTSAKRTHS